MELREADKWSLVGFGNTRWEPQGEFFSLSFSKKASSKKEIRAKKNHPEVGLGKCPEEQSQHLGFSIEIKTKNCRSNEAKALSASSFASLEKARRKHVT
jgi:hypothetical protein